MDSSISSTRSCPITYARGHALGFAIVVIVWVPSRSMGSLGLLNGCFTGGFCAFAIRHWWQLSVDMRNMGKTNLSQTNKTQQSSNNVHIFAMYSLSTWWQRSIFDSTFQWYSNFKYPCMFLNISLLILFLENVLPRQCYLPNFWFMAFTCVKIILFSIGGAFTQTILYSYKVVALRLGNIMYMGHDIQHLKGNPPRVVPVCADLYFNAIPLSGNYFVHNLVSILSLMAILKPFSL